MSTEHGYILIADITGYTQYLHDSELDHAQKSLTALLNLLIQQTRPPLKISRLAGDAVISYGLRDEFFQGQTFVELIEDTYVTFRRTIDLMVLNTTCECRACRNIGNLDLKFFVHYGAFALQKLDAHDELVGSDVNLIHRLLKNTVTETTGVSAYALYSQAAIEQLGLRDLCEIMIQHDETYEHLGDVTVWVQDMHPVWEEKKERLDISIAPENIVFEVEAEIDQPIEVVWDHIADVRFRNILMGSDRQETDQRVNGRLTAGSKFLCYHGEKLTVQTIVHWKPFEHMITHDVVTLPFGSATVEIDYRLSETETGGTRFVHGFGKAVSGPWLVRQMLNLMGRSMKKDTAERIQAFGKAVEENTRALADAKQAAEPPTEEMVSAAIFDSLRKKDET